MDTYTIRLETIHISRTRSHNTDTNFLTFSYKDGTGQSLQIYAKLGDMPDGDYSVSDLINRMPQPSMGIGPSNAADFIEIVNPRDPVIISWAIVNRGHANDQQALNEIQQIGDNLINQYLGSGSGAGTGSTSSVSRIHPNLGIRSGAGPGGHPRLGVDDGGDGGDPPVSGNGDDTLPTGMSDTSMDSAGWGSKTDWSQIAKWVFGGILNLLDPNCDGGVVAQTITTSAAELAVKTQGGAKFEKTLEYPGTDSAVGCGANSLYFVTYSITHTYTPDNTTQQQAHRAM